MGRVIPYIMETKLCLKPPTRFYLVVFGSSSNQSSPLPRSNQHIKVHLLGKLVDGTPHEPVGIWWFPLPILDTLQKNKFFAG